MKNQLSALIIIGAALSVTYSVHAQPATPLSGMITYQEVMSMQMEKTEENAAFYDMIPKEQKMSRVLYFTPTESLYVNAKEDKKDAVDRTEGGQHMVIRMDVPDERYYQDISGQTMTVQRDFMGRKFLVEDKINPGRWKLTGNQEKILGYPCQEAVLEDGDVKMRAWFTPALAVSTGPSNAGGLPGIILKLDVNNGLHVINATSVNQGPVDQAIIKKPKDGKKMTKKEYMAMVEEKSKEMGGDGNNVIIKVRH